MIRNQGEESFDDDLREFLAALPDGGAYRLRQLREVAFGARALFELEAERLAARAAPDERVAELRGAAMVRLELADVLEAEVEAAGIRPPETRPAEALLHGRVLDPRLRGLADLRARLVDAQGRDLPDVEPAATDTSGYYAFVLPAETVERLQDTPVSVVFEAGDERLTPPETTRLPVAPNTAVFREVAVAASIVERLRPTLTPELLRPRPQPRAGGAPAGAARPRAKRKRK